MLTVFKSKFINFINYIKYINYCIISNLKCSTSNLKSFTIQTLFMFLNNFMWLVVWLILFYNSNGNNINGVTLKDILYIWSAPTLSYGICYFVFGGIEDLGYKIANKDLDTLLTRPKHSLIAVITSNSKLSAMGDILYGLLLGIFATNFNLVQYLFLIAISLVGALGFLGINIIVYSLSFFVKDISRSAKLYVDNLVLTLTIYPENMFGKFIKILMYTVIPAMYVAHIPIKIIKTYDMKLLIYEFIAVSILLLLSCFIYNKGIKKYIK